MIEQNKVDRVVRVDLGERSYDIHVGKQINTPDLIKKLSPATVMVVSDDIVDHFYGNAVETGIKAIGIKVFKFMFPAGEKSKTLSTVEAICSKCAEAGMDRNSLIVALGGGVVGDTAGFAAAVYCRGIRYVQIPTTLLAMVDSAVGGKTAVNLQQGKNLVGAFHQPSLVAADLATLASLPDKEYNAGIAEVVKYGVIWSADLFALIEEKNANLIRREECLLTDIIAQCCRIKADVVKMDEKEGGVRAVLNFGHTLGHALETLTAYEPLHGEAVAVGMVYGCLLSERVKGFSRDSTLRLVKVLSKFRLGPAAWSGWQKLPWSTVRQAMEVDKKKKGGTPRWILVDRLGSVAFGCQVPEDILSETWERFRKGEAWQMVGEGSAG